MNPPRNKPLPFHSRLWPHVDLIRSMRQNVVGWKEISDILDRDFSIRLHPTTICNWWNRYINRGKPLPYGIRKETVEIKPKIRIHVKQDAPRKPLQVIE